MSYSFFGGNAVTLRDENGLTVQAMYDLLKNLWSADTCAPRMRKEWTRQNPTLGQCSVTAFLAQDLFGGQVYGVPLGDGNFHCYNAVDGQVFDLTSEQFGDIALQYEGNPLQTREAHFEKEEKYQRYLALRKGFFQEYAVLLKHSGCNCCQAVLCAYARQTGIPTETMKKMTAAFAVGMGCMESTCGALIAAEMLLGIFRYQGAPMFRPAKALYQAFTKQCGASVCKELKGADTGCVLCECDDCVRAAVGLVENVLHEK